jgi:hypothetical protein
MRSHPSDHRPVSKTGQDLPPYRAVPDPSRDGSAGPHRFTASACVAPALLIRAPGADLWPEGCGCLAASLVRSWRPPPAGCAGHGHSPSRLGWKYKSSGRWAVRKRGSRRSGAGRDALSLFDCSVDRPGWNESRSRRNAAGGVKRATGIEPVLRAWKALVQPLHHARARV